MEVFTEENSLTLVSLELWAAWEAAEGSTSF